MIVVVETFITTFQPPLGKRILDAPRRWDGEKGLESWLSPRLRRLQKLVAILHAGLLPDALLNQQDPIGLGRKSRNVRQFVEQE